MNDATTKRIKIKTGANISSILQSTVNIPQAFTELVKNSIQNLATYIKIDIESDRILIEDNGKGFDDTEDSSGKSDFDKYFVFGNSYDTTGGSGIRLGHMGIGGKLSNDKLSRSGDPNWSIHTKNKNKKAFVVNYNPGQNEFLDDYSPEILELSYENSLLKPETGALIIINDINKMVQEKKILQQITIELKTFFGFLVGKLSEEGKEFKIILNGSSLDFDYRLPGTAFGDIKEKFEYDLYGEKKETQVEFKLSMVGNRSILDKHPLKNVEIISEVKVCNFNLSDSDLIENIYKKISEESGKKVDVQPSVLNLFRNLVGFISCPQLSSVLDKTGMPAKDLSHHGLRDDHPITEPFLRKCYEVVIDVIRAYLKLESENRDEKFKQIVIDITEMLSDNDDLDDDLLVDTDEGVDADEIDRNIKNAAKRALNKIEYDPLNQKLNREQNWEDKIKPPTHAPKKRKVLNYEILDFGIGFEGEMARVSDFDSFKIMINSGNNKFKKIDEQENPLFMAAHIAECLITEIAEFKDPSISLKQVQDKVSNFYSTSYDKMKERFLNT
jgi:hypothetical protein